MSEIPDVYRSPRAQPPVNGLMAQRHWRRNRIDDILEAIESHRRGKYWIPPEWAKELAEHLEWVYENDDTKKLT